MNLSMSIRKARQKKGEEILLQDYNLRLCGSSFVRISLLCCQNVYMEPGYKGLNLSCYDIKLKEYKEFSLYLNSMMDTCVCVCVCVLLFKEFS